jgi:hypothetical protein
VSKPRNTTRLTVIICTRNPRQDIFRRVISALAAQTLPTEQWALLVIDNASLNPITLPTFNGLPVTRVIVEKQVGLTHARLRGIADADGELLVFVDDDNIIASNYLSEAIELMKRRPDLGAWSGKVTPEFESPPPAWIGPFASHLALSVIDHDNWSTSPPPNDVLPVGAGLCIRKHLAQAYARQVRGDSRRRNLDRKGTSTASAGDTDMALTCIDSGFATGRFISLELIHVIPSNRLDFSYQRQLAHGIGESYGFLIGIRGGISTITRMRVWTRTLKSLLGLIYRGKTRTLDLDYHFGFLRGLRRAKEL